MLKKAQVIGGKPPLGYDIGPDKRYIINPKEAEAVRIIFDKIIEGWSYTAIARYLNDKGYKTKRGVPFSSIFVDTLTNEKYKGEYVFNKTQKKSPNGSRNNHARKPESEIIRIPNGIPKIVDEDVFDEVQKIVEQRKIRNYRGMYKTKYLLSGRIICGHCGYAASGNVSFNRNDKVPRVTYRHARTTKTNCGVKDIPVERLDSWVLDTVLKDFSAITNASKYLNKLNEEIKNKSQEIEDEIEALDTEIDTLETTIKTTIQNMASEQGINAILIEELREMKIAIYEKKI